MGAGRLAGIARHSRPRGPIEELSRVAVTRGEGLQGDFRGAVKPGRVPRRQVSLIEAESWRAALVDLGADLGADPGSGLFDAAGLDAGLAIPWHARRANLLVEGLRLPREPGRVIAIGPTLRIEVTRECDPCSRMEEIAPGLKAALTPDWRGGVLGRVLDDGEIAVGNEVRIEE